MLAHTAAEGQKTKFSKAIYTPPTTKQRRLLSLSVGPSRHPISDTVGSVTTLRVGRSSPNQF